LTGEYGMGVSPLRIATVRVALLERVNIVGNPGDIQIRTS